MQENDTGRRDTGIRCFVAVDLAREVGTEIDALTTQLSRTGADVRWIPSENLHVTLKFLGQISETSVETVRAGLADVAATTAPFHLAAGGLGAFPSPQRARIVWVGLSGDGLEALAALVDERLASVGLPRETRAFAPHVTIGRVRRFRGWDRALAAVESFGQRSFGASWIDHIVLYRSELRPEGARYTALHRLRLEGQHAAKESPGRPTTLSQNRRVPPMPRRVGGDDGN